MKLFNVKIYKRIIFNLWSIFSRFIPKKIYLKIMYRYLQGKKLSIKNPKTFTEKIQWKKIYDKNPLYTKLSDKYAVREYIKEKIGEKYLIPLLLHTDKPEEIPFDKLPLPYIIKSNHGWGHTIIIRNKEDINKKEIIKKCKKWLKYNHYWSGRELQYKNIKPLILIEKLLLDERDKIPNDYKFSFFNNNLEFIWVCIDRFGDKKSACFDKDWKLLNLNWGSKINGKLKWKLEKDIPKPKNLKKMIAISNVLSRGFDYIRVDLYSVKNKIYFGELTLTPGSGFDSFFPEKWDLIFGKKLNLDN